MYDMIQVLFIVNFEKDVNSWAMVIQNLACFFFLLPPPTLPHTHTHIAGRIDKQLDTMEVHKRHVEELWKNALNIAEQLKQVRQHTMSRGWPCSLSFSVSYEAGLYHILFHLFLLPRRFRCPQWSHSRVWYQWNTPRDTKHWRNNLIRCANQVCCMV